MSRPAGDPATLAAGSRRLGAAATALREVAGRLREATSLLVVAGAWRGPASEAFLVDGLELRSGLGRAAGALDQAAGALAELSARLAHAQATWDRARRLAATAGVALDPHGEAAAPALGRARDPQSGASAPPFRRQQAPGGGVLSPATAVDPAASLVAGQALQLAQEAEQEAAAARRVAASRLDHAAEQAAATHRPSGHGRVGGRQGGGASRPHPADAPAPSRAQHPPGGQGSGEDRHGGPVERVVGRVLEVGAEVARTTHHLVVAAEARVQAAGRLAATADDPAARAAAARVAETAGRPLVDGRMLGALPLAAPILDFTAAMRQGEPLPRALAGTVGSAIGADLGARAGLAACGGEAAATQGAGLIICPTLTAVGGTLGAHAGRAAALHVYDELTNPQGDHAGSSPSGPDSGAHHERRRR